MWRQKFEWVKIKLCIMRLQNDRLFAFSGLMFAGKDFVANYAKLNVFGFADPIYDLSDHFNGTHDKSIPGIRRWMQLVGQWGWGCVSEEYLFNVERGILTDLIRRFGGQMTRRFVWVDWSEYGKRKDFWVNILLSRLGINNKARRSGQMPLFDSGYPESLQVAITNARFDHELNPLANAGFDHFHVRCSEETRAERMVKAGYQVKPTDATDHSEHMAIRLNADMPDRRVIWNDHRPMPEGRRFLTLDQFLATSQKQTGAVAAPMLARREAVVAA